MRNNKRKYIELCTGCGLCASVKGIELQKDEKGFLRPSNNLKNEELEFLQKVCPASGVQCSYMQGKIWGDYESVSIGYSSDEQIRHNASSGGVITGLLLYLLDAKKVDAVIHVKENPKKPVESIVTCSTTREEIINNSGSRYCSTATLSIMRELLEKNVKYVLVGKPCDIAAMRNYAKINPQVDEKIVYMLSFFCAGAPSEQAQYQLLRKVGCPEDKCTHIQYRGNGWPGYATAKDDQGNSYQTIYQEAWSKTLGRDIRLMCRFCIDGIGELADISCGDAWYFDEAAQKTVFDENEGRNVIFTRNKKGEQLFEEAVMAGYIEMSDERITEEYLNKIQRYQYHRKSTLRAALLAMKLMKREVPSYKKSLLKAYSKKIDLKSKLGFFKGTLLRIGKGII